MTHQSQQEPNKDGHPEDMKNQKITDKMVRELSPPTSGNQILVRDSLLIGFAVRITANGFVSFVLNYNCNGAQRRLTIGSPPSWSVAAAREEAKKLRRMADVGRDPLEERRSAKSEPVLSELWARYETDVLSTRADKTQKNVKSIWKRLIQPKLGSKKLSAILPQDIDRLHREVSKLTPTQSNRMLATLQHLFSTAMRWRLVTSNPVKGVQRNREDRRERFLSHEELSRLLSTLDQRTQTPSILAVRFLLMTGARSGETFRAKWDEIDLKTAVWSKPASNTKNGKSHRVPLSPDAVKLLKILKAKRQNKYVFYGKARGHLTTIKKVFNSVMKEAEIVDIRVHDLRHSYASFLIEQGVTLPVIGRLLGHSQIATTSRYAHLVDADLRSATNIMGQRISKNG